MDRTVLITGASSGIGLATALHAASLGFGVVGLVPDEEGGQALLAAAGRGGVHVDVLVLDLGDPAARRNVGGRVDAWALVNNAGYMNAGQIRDVSVDDARRQLEVMVLAPADLSRQLLKGMVERGQGRIVNVTSSAAHTSTPLTGWYAAAKAALREINDALRLELRGTGVDVVDVEPGGYRTGIWEGAKRELARRRSSAAEPDLYDRAISKLAPAEAMMGDPQEVAQAIGELLTDGAPPSHRRVGPGARRLRVADAVVPDRVWDAVVSAVARTGDRLPWVPR